MKTITWTLLLAALNGWATTLTWNPNAEANIAGYIVYQGPASHNYTNKIYVGSATNYSLTITGTNYFAVTAYTTTGMESDFSNEVSWPASTNTARLLVLTSSALNGPYLTWTSFPICITNTGTFFKLAIDYSRPAMPIQTNVTKQPAGLPPFPK